MGVDLDRHLGKRAPTCAACDAEIDPEVRPTGICENCMVLPADVWGLMWREREDDGARGPWIMSYDSTEERAALWRESLIRMGCEVSPLRKYVAADGRE